VLGDAPQATAVRSNEVDIRELEAFPSAFGRWKIASPIRGEGDPLSIGRPCGTKIAAVA
jgi:hypothetical protein